MCLFVIVLRQSLKSWGFIFFLPNLAIFLENEMKYLTDLKLCLYIFL